MRIAMLSDCESTGGAAVAATRLSMALERLGADVTRIVSRGSESEATMVIRAPLRVPTRWTTPRVASVARNLWSGRAERALKRALDEIQPDVISIHNLHNATAAGWSPRFVEICSERAPCVWTLHDMWSFTGRCAHSGDCAKFVTGCDASCPTPREYPAFPPSRIRDEWEWRRRIIAEHPNLVAVAPSRWLANRATSGLWPSARVEVIPNGVDTNVYALSRQPAAGSWQTGSSPAALSALPAANCRLIIATQDFRDARKGAPFLAAALRILSRSGILCMTLGKNPEAVDWSGTNVRHLGWIEGDAEKAAAFGSADFLVHPSLAENLPNVVLEAMACGTPTVGFDVGGMGEAVVEGVTGWLCDSPSTAGLARGINRTLDDIEHGNDLRASSRAYALEHYDLATIGARYMQLFRSVAGGSATS